MIELGKLQTLKVIREAKQGFYLGDITGDDTKQVLLPKSNLEKNISIEDEIEVFIYRDSEDRIISTTKKPKILIGELKMLKVIETTKIGAFLDWGLEKDLFLPFKEQMVKVEKDQEYLVSIYVDKSDRISATTCIYDFLRTDSPYTKNQRVKGMVYSINPRFGVFVAVENKYHGLIPSKEVTRIYNVGESVEARIKTIRDDGKLELSIRSEAYNEMESDAQKIMSMLKRNKGFLKLNDKSSPEQIKRTFKISKGAFKRAVGRLMKEGAIEQTGSGIKLLI
jgi:predicted RNA-binding protein (virulence factor B family)